MYLLLRWRQHQLLFWAFVWSHFTPIHILTAELLDIDLFLQISSSLLSSSQRFCCNILVPSSCFDFWVMVLFLLTNFLIFGVFITSFWPLYHPVLILLEFLRQILVTSKHSAKRSTCKLRRWVRVINEIITIIHQLTANSAGKLGFLVTMITSECIAVSGERCKII